MKYLKKGLLLFICGILMFTVGCGNKVSESTKVKGNAVGRFYSMKELLTNVKTPDEIYAKVQEALDDGMSLDLTDTELTVSKPLVLYNQNIYGGKITYTGNDGQPVLKIAGKCSIENVTLVNTCEDVNCGEGKYVGIWLSNEKGKVTSGSVIRNVYFSKCGTLVYAPKDVEAAACGLAVENFRGESWTFRAIDFQSPKCENNYFSNLYLASGFAPGSAGYNSAEALAADCAFYLNGSVSATVKQLNVEHCNIKRPIVFENCDKLNVSTIHIEGVNTAEDGRGYLNIAGTNGRIGAVDFYWTRVYAKNSAAVKLEDSATDGNELTFETFLVKGINDPSQSDPGVVRGIKNCGLKFFARDGKYTNPYYVTILNYVPFSFATDDRGVLEEFYADKDNITFKQIGQLPAGGTTAERPTKRLCAGYTEYFDTTLGKTVKWNGKAWE